MCNLCGEVKELCNAHIIPKAFYYAIRRNNETPSLFYIDQLTYPKKIPVGIYDSTILCSQCDNDIGKYDDYAAKLLLNNNSDVIDYNGGKFIKIETFDYVKLKLFFLSVIWRASISKNDFFSSIDLGEYDPIIKSVIAKKQLSCDEYFSCILAKYNDDLSNCITNPCKMRSKDGVNYYRMRIAEYVLLIKIDKRPFHSGLNEYIIQPDKPLIIRYKSFKDSSDFRGIIKYFDDYL